MVRHAHARAPRGPVDPAARAAGAPARRDPLERLGYRATAEAVGRRLAVLAGTGTGPVLVAAGGDRVLGLIAAHWTPMPFADAPIARITTLVVDETARGLGVGGRLVDAVASLARRAGCAPPGVATAAHRADARAFYGSAGFTVSSWRLHRPFQDG